MRFRASTVRAVFLMAILLLSSLFLPSAIADPNPDAPFMNDPVAWNAQVNLTWTVPYDYSHAIEGYNIYRGTAPGLETMYCTVTGPSSTAYADKNLTNGQTYYYYIVAINYYGASEPSNTVVATPYGPPGIPTALNGVPGAGFINLSWTAPYDNGGTPIIHYRIYRGTQPGAEIFLATSEATTYVDSGLSEGRTFYYKVSAVTNAPIANFSEGNRSAELKVVLNNVPGPVTTLVATSWNGSIMLNWTAPADIGGSPITGYQVHRGTTMGSETFLGNAPSNYYNDTALVNGQIYYYRIAASNYAGPGPLSNEVSATPLSVPSAPITLQGFKGDQQAVLTWSAPVIEGGTPILEYRIYRGTTPGAEIFLTKSATLNYTDGDLTNGRIYYYKVSAVNALGEGSKSTAVTVIPLTVPGAPGGASARGDLSKVVLTWTQPTVTGGANITGYNIYRGEGPGTGTFLMAVGKVLTFTDAGLPANTAYYYYVTAINGAGEGAPSIEVHATTHGVPSVPLTVAAVPGNTSIHLSWSQPIDNGRTPIIHYKIYRGTTSGSEVLLTTSEVLAYNDIELTNGQTYYYRVSAVNAVGEGPLSPELSSIPALPPIEPVWLVASPSSQQVTLNWTAPLSDGGSPITGYRIYRSTPPGNVKSLLTTVVGTTYIDGGLVNGETYYYQVSAYNAAGEGTLSSEVTVTPSRAPGQPTGLVAVGGLRQAGLNWTAPSDNGGSSITGYNIYRGTSPHGEGAMLVVAGVRSPFTDTGLEDATTYYYQVSAVNSVGAGLRSEMASATTLFVPPPPPNLVAAVKDRAVDLAWEASVSNDGSPIIYRVYRSASSGTETYLATVSSTSYHDGDVVNGLTYHYFVTAVNATGDGRMSNEVSALPCTLPSAPLNITAEPGDGRTIVQWNSPYDNGGSAVTSYKLYWKNSPSEEFRVMSVSEMSLYHGGLVNGNPYYYKVAAVNAAGEGPASETIVATPAAMPAPPSDLTATGGDQQVVLTWTAPMEWADSNILGYRIYRGNDSQDLQLYDVSTDATYTDTEVINGQTYYYRVSAINATGEGRMSNEANATPNIVPQDLMSVLGNYWLELIIIAIAVLVVVGVVFLMFGSGMLSLGKEGLE